MNKNKNLLTYKIIEDKFPILTKPIKEYEEHCVTYIIHNNKQIYVGETSHLLSRFKDHNKTKKNFKFIECKIISSEFFNKSAVYDLESRLINCIYADRSLELINIKKDQASHNYYLKEQINDQLFRDIWKELQKKKIVKKSLYDIENDYLFKYSPFKEFSLNQLEVINSVIEIISTETEIEDIAFDGSIINLRKLNPKGSKTIIRGGPGTGKTLVLVKLVHDLTKRYGISQDEIAICIPQSNLNKIFKTMFKELKLKCKIIKPVDLSKVADQQYNLLIVDEAHRLKQMFSKQTKDLKHLLGGKINEFDLACSKSKNLILLYDEKQSVRPADITYVDNTFTKNFKQLHLTEQFRVKKGHQYLDFLEALLQISDNVPNPNDLGDYEFEIIDSIKELHKLIIKKDKKFGLARLGSGYFKKWISKKDPSLHDFKDEGIDIPWNRTIIGWSNSKTALYEVGCIHTLQGVDLNYAGIIIGDEIYFDTVTQKIKIRKENYYDSNGTPVNGTDNENINLTKYIKNIYYVLLSRGMMGTYLYIKDPDLKAYVETILSQRKSSSKQQA